MNSKKGMLKIRTSSTEQTQRLGYHLGSLAKGGDIFLLTGNLGAGKTCLVQGISFGLGVKEYACSPSFMIAREYHGRLTLYHLDLYRLDHIEEVADLGIEGYLNSNTVCAIEWAEKGCGVLPQDNLSILMRYASENERNITFKPRGQRFLELVRQFKEALENDDEIKWNFQ